MENENGAYYFINSDDKNSSHNEAAKEEQRKEEQRKENEKKKKKKKKLASLKKVIAVSACVIFIFISINYLMSAYRNQHDEVDDETVTDAFASKPTAEPTANPTAEPTAAPTQEEAYDEPYMKTADTGSMHILNPTYGEYHDPVYDIYIPYPNHFGFELVKQIEGSETVSYYKDEDDLRLLKDFMYDPSNYMFEMSFAAANFDKSAYVWSTVISDSKCGFSTPGELLAWQRKNEGGVQDGSASNSKNFYYLSVESPYNHPGMIHYRYCKHMNEKFYTIDILFPKNKMSVYVQGETEGYCYDLYDKFKSRNFD